jgi:ADP-ribose pyrophosphatase YjhB (NUDIX family)
MDGKLTVRVYGLLEWDGALLLSRENIKGQLYVKFPGGGLEWGEGPRETVVREFKEEAGVSVRAEGHFYTTDFFVPSSFHARMQVISLYYRVSCAQPETIPVAAQPYQAALPAPGDMVLFWQPRKSLREEQLDLPIDKHVCRLIKRG